MFLKSLRLTNFRNYQTNFIEFNKPITYIYGRNGVGKSNIIEAVHLLATGSSFRTSEMGNLISHGSAFTKVEGTVFPESIELAARSKDLEYVNKEINKLEVFSRFNDNIQNNNIDEIEIIINRNTLETDEFTSAGINRTYNRNGVPRNKRNFSGAFKAVVFSPETMDLVSGPSILRRRYLDLAISQRDDGYRKLIGVYEKARVTRNKILYQIKYGTAKLPELDYWNGVLVDTGVVIERYREGFVNFANNYLTNSSSRYLEENCVFGITYLASRISLEILSNNTDKDISAERTLIGPHRDDFTFVTKKSGSHTSNLSYYGSRGNQRLATYLLKLAETEYLTDENSRPLILLDDVFSELDATFRTAITNNLADYQTILTGVDPSYFEKSLFKMGCQEISLL